MHRFLTSLGGTFGYVEPGGPVPLEPQPTATTSTAISPTTTLDVVPSPNPTSGTIPSSMGRRKLRIRKRRLRYQYVPRQRPRCRVRPPRQRPVPNRPSSTVSTPKGPTRKKIRDDERDKIRRDRCPKFKKSSDSDKKGCWSRFVWIVSLFLNCLRYGDWQYWNPNPKSIWVQFIKRTKVDGLKNIFKPNIHTVKRIFYGISFTACAYNGISFMCSSYKDIHRYPVLIRYAGTIPIEHTGFPQVSYISTHAFTLKSLDEAKWLYEKAIFNGNATDGYGNIWNRQKAAKVLFHMKRVCEGTNSFGKRLGAIDPKRLMDLTKLESYLKEENNTLTDDPEDSSYKDFVLPFIKNASISCPNTVAGCLWIDNECKEIFVPVLTENGYSCTFNSLQQEVVRRLNLTPDTMHEFPKKFKELMSNWDKNAPLFLGASPIPLNEILRRQKVAGVQNGLRLLIKFDPNQLACPLSDGFGILLDLHSPFEVTQPLARGILIQPHTVVRVSLHTEVMVADESIRALAEDVRRCYFRGEYVLGRHPIYTEANCKKECITVLIFQKCKCYRIFDTDGKNEKICGAENEQCVKDVLDEVKTKGYDNVCYEQPNPAMPKKCYDTCEGETYSTEVSVSQYAPEHFFYSDALTIGEEDITASVEIGHKSETATLRERHEQFGLWEIIGIMGGVLGLTNGVSFISAIHIIIALHYLFTKLWKLMCPKQDQPDDEDDEEYEDVEEEDEEEAEGSGRTVPTAVMKCGIVPAAIAGIPTTNIKDRTDDGPNNLPLVSEDKTGRVTDSATAINFPDRTPSLVDIISAVVGIQGIEVSDQTTAEETISATELNTTHPSYKMSSAVSKITDIPLAVVQVTPPTDREAAPDTTSISTVISNIAAAATKITDIPLAVVQVTPLADRDDVAKANSNGIKPVDSNISAALTKISDIPLAVVQVTPLADQEAVSNTTTGISTAGNNILAAMTKVTDISLTAVGIPALGTANPRANIRLPDVPHTIINIPDSEDDDDDALRNMFTIRQQNV